jgi:cephalosporin hydroxylase
MEKKMLSRSEFEELRIQSAARMAQDKELAKSALDVKVKAGHEYYWVHQSNWFGEPTLQLAQDLMAIQDIIFRTRPDYIIESGVCWGGGLIFYSTLMEALGGKKIIGIDIYIPEDLKERIFSHGKLSDRIELIEGSSVDQTVVDKVKALIPKGSKVLVILDSLHTHDHVLKELQHYSPLVETGQYLICGDTSIEFQPPADLRPRPWGKGNNPKTALDEFMKTNDRFEVDQQLQNKLLFTNCPGGYLKCIKN